MWVCEVRLLLASRDGSGASRQAGRLAADLGRGRRVIPVVAHVVAGVVAGDHHKVRAWDDKRSCCLEKANPRVCVCVWVCVCVVCVCLCVFVCLCLFLFVCVFLCLFLFVFFFFFF